MGWSTWLRLRAWSFMLLLAALYLSGCGRAPQSMMDPAGPVAEIQLDLLSFDLKMVSIIGIVMVALILYVAIRFRRKPGDNSLPEQVESNRKLEIGWTLGVVLILIPLAIEPISASFALAAEPTGPDVVNVRVIGHQWWWEFEYPDLGIVTANEMHIPAGKKVNLTITSADVIHGFWVPRLAGKTDAFPGRMNKMWLQADEAGEYSGQCTELCGTSHADMRFKVIAQSPADFQAWVQARKTPVVVDKMSAGAQRGWKIFNDKGCVACHTVDGTTAKGKVGPNLTGLGSRTTLAAGVLENTDEYLAKWLRSPQSVKPRTSMPNLGLKPEEISAVSEFLRSQK